MRMRLIALLLTVAPGLAAASTLWDSDSPLLAPIPGSPELLHWSAVAAGDGSYVVGVGRSDGVSELLHFDADHQQLRRHRRIRGESAYAIAGAFGLTRLGDGKLYEFDWWRTSQVGENGMSVWVSGDLVARGDLRNRIKQVLRSPTSPLWVSVEERRSTLHRVIRIDQVGRQRIAFESPLGEISAIALAGDDGLYVSRRVNGAPRITRLEAGGDSRWSTNISTPQNTYANALLALDDDHLLVVAQTLYEVPLRLIELDHAGAEVARHELNLDLPPRAIRFVRQLNDHSIQLVAEDYNGANSIIQLAPDRSLAWKFTLPDDTDVLARYLGPPALFNAGEQTRFIARQRVVVDDESIDRYFYYALAADGMLLREVLLPDDPKISGFEPRPSHGDFLSLGRPGQVDGDGVFHQLPLPDLYRSDERALILAAYSAGDERFAVIERRAGRELQAWRRDGSIRWVAGLERPNNTDRSPIHAQLQVSDRALCWFANDSTSGEVILSAVQCFDRQSGAPGLSFQPVNPYQHELPHLLLQGGIVARFAEGGTTLTLRFESALDGAMIRPALSGLNPNLRIVGQPGGGGVGLSGGADVAVYWFDGVTPAEQAFPAQFGSKFILPSGIIQGNYWQPRGTDLLTQPISGPGFSVQVAGQGNPVVIAEPANGGLKLTGLEGATGEVLWTDQIESIEGIPHESVTLADSATADEVVLLVNADADFDLYRIARRDGSRIQTRSFECGAAPCQFHLGGIPHSDAGLDLMVLRQQDAGASALRALHTDLDEPAAVAAQAGVAGLWYHPGLQGQGLVLTYIADSQTLFSPWFTYDSFSTDNDQSDARWYSLQGQASTASDTVDLDLLANRGGVFAAPPQVAAESAGSARLSFHSCDRATLEFDEADRSFGLTQGSLPLLRLGPRTRSCELHDGSIQPGVSVADRSGFSTRQSGAWFDPATSGQGLMVEVVPPSEDDDGLLFAAWFTYDLSPASNDTISQDWFILQSHLSTANAGRAVVPIFRSIGGQHVRRATTNLFRVGEAELTFASCQSLTVAYRFDDTELAAEHGGINGQLQLQRIGGCES